jgi:hypothetical protein
MEYHLKPIGKVCAATANELVPGTVCHSVVVGGDEDEDGGGGGGMIRLDFSEEGWSGPPEGTIGYWKSIVPDSTKPKNKPLDPDALMNYFEQIYEDANPAQEKFGYVLSLMLLQKRRLRLDGSRYEGETEYLELSGSRGEGPFTVRNSNLSDDEIVEFQSSLNSHLDSEWN